MLPSAVAFKANYWMVCVVKGQLKYYKMFLQLNFSIMY